MPKRNLLFIVMLILCVAYDAEGQTVSIRKDEFDKALSAGLAKTATRHRRETTNAKKFRDSKVVEEELTTQDFSPPDKERWLILARSGDKNTRVEIVYVGDVEYRREDKGQWKIVDKADPKNQIIGLESVKNGAKPAIAYTREDKSLDGMRVQIFVERSTFQTRRITLDAYGYILDLEESVSEGATNNLVYTSRLSIVYSEHPIFIEAPIK